MQTTSFSLADEFPAFWHRDIFGPNELARVFDLTADENKQDFLSMLEHDAYDTAQFCVTVMNSGEKALPLARMVMTILERGLHVERQASNESGRAVFTQQEGSRNTSVDNIAATFVKAIKQMKKPEDQAYFLLRPLVYTILGSYLSESESAADFENLIGVIETFEPQDQFSVLDIYHGQSGFFQYFSQENLRRIRAMIFKLSPQQQFEILAKDFAMSTYLTPEESFQYVSGVGDQSRRAALLANPLIVDELIVFDPVGTMKLVADLDDALLGPIFDFPNDSTDRNTEQALSEAGFQHSVSAVKRRMQAYKDKRIGTERDGLIPDGP